MPKWSRVDVFDVDAEVIDENLCVYRDTAKKVRGSFDDYVKDALKSGNHVAFAREFIDTFIKYGEYALPYDELESLATRKVEEYLCQKGSASRSHKRGLSKEQKKVVEMHKKLQNPYYIKDTAWRSPDCVYPLDESCLKNEKKDANSEPEKKSAGKVVYSQYGRKNWKNNTRIKRDVLIQHAFVMGLNADETDLLLMKAGYPSLYPLDAVDACAIINLNEYAGKLDLSPYEVLRKVKSDINNILRELEGSEFVFIRRGTADGAKQGILTYAAGRNIDVDLQEIRKLLDKQDTECSEAFKPGDGLTRFLTKYYSEKIRNAHDAAAYFHDSGIEANAIFTQRYYGFLKKSKDYLYDWQRYCKNLGACTWKLTPEFSSHDFVADHRGKFNISAFDRNIQTVLMRLMKEKADSDKYYEDCLRLIQYVRTFDTLNKSSDLIIYNAFKNDQFTYGRVLIEGEKKSYKNTVCDESGESETSKTGYAFEMRKKHDVVRFAISAGREEEIGEYLVLARYWKKDWYREISQGKSMDECQKEGFYPDPIDKLLIYALLYRDRLIEKWSCRMKNSTVAQNRIRDMFPMRELILEISYDISFAYMYGLRHVHKTAINNLSDIKKIYTEFENLRQDMIFPVQWRDWHGNLLTYNRTLSTYKNVKQDSDGNSKKSNPQKEDAER